MIFKKIVFGYFSVFLFNHSFCEDINFSKFDLSMFKLYLLKSLHENCKPDPKTNAKAPLCETMQSMIDNVDKLFKSGSVPLKETALSILHIVKKDLADLEEVVLNQDYSSNLNLTIIKPEEIELFARIDTFIERIESKKNVSDEEFDVEFNMILAKYEEYRKKRDGTETKTTPV